MKQLGFYDESTRLKKLSNLGDNLEKLNKTIDWELFRPLITKTLEKEQKGVGGRPSYDYILMFKILILQRIYNLSDDQTEYQINDRMSFMRFLGLGIVDTIPDSKTIWHFKNELTKSNIIVDLFNLFGKELEMNNLITREGTIVDATFIDAPRQRNSRDENKIIKGGDVPEEWLEPAQEHKLAQKDLDATWTKKGSEKHYGYKNHVKVDSDSKVILDYEVTTASVHDSNEFVDFIDETDKVVYADSAYSSAKIATNLPENVDNQIHEKASRNNPLTEEQKESNRIKSKTRARIEHVFGFMTGSMNGLTLRSIGLKRAEFNIGLTNLIYNMFRFEILTRK